MSESRKEGAMNRFGEALMRVRQLARSGDIDGLIKELENPLEDDLIVVRGRAADHLGKLRARAAVRPLIRMLRKDPNEHARTHAVRALGEIGTPDVIPPLREALEDRGLAVRSWAALNLAELGDRAATPALIRQLEDRDAIVRRAAAKALLKLGETAAIEPLERMAQGESPLRKRTIRRGINRLRSRGTAT